MKKDEDNDIENAHSFIFGVNKPELQLWYVDEFGNLKEPSDKNDIDYIAIGSGKKEVKEYVERIIADQEVDRDKITIGVAIDIMKGAMKSAEKDANTGLGYNLVIITEKEVRDHGEEIKRAIVSAEKTKLEEIKTLYNGVE